MQYWRMTLKVKKRPDKLWSDPQVYWRSLTFSPNTKKGVGKVCSLLEQFTEDLWISAALPSVVSTFRFSRWTQTLGYIPRHSRATTWKETTRLLLSQMLVPFRLGGCQTSFSWRSQRQQRKRIAFAECQTNRLGALVFVNSPETPSRMLFPTGLF